MGDKKVIQNLFRQGPWWAETETQLNIRISPTRSNEFIIPNLFVKKTYGLLIKFSGLLIKCEIIHTQCRGGPGLIKGEK